MSEFKAIGGTPFMTSEPPGGMGLHLFSDQSGHIRGTLAIDISKQGPPGYAHGGSLIALLDETMGAAAWSLGYRCVAANLQFNLRQSVPLGMEVTVTAEVAHVEGRKVFTVGQILLPEGAVAVEAQGLFIIPHDHAVHHIDFNPFVVDPDG
jgi:acyl-coenzyme A thioesterase PaaI-like protein